MTGAGTTVSGPTGITSRLDLLTRRWWRAVGRPVDLAGEHAWLDAPMAGGSGFRSDDLHADVRAFYEHTSDWRMEVWTGWAPLFWPGGELISRLFGRRVGQLALPMRPLDVAHGMDSRVSVITDGEGTQQAAGWLRTLRSTGDYVYSGCYSHRILPGSDRTDHELRLWAAEVVRLHTSWSRNPGSTRPP